VGRLGESVSTVPTSHRGRELPSPWTCVAPTPGGARPWDGWDRAAFGVACAIGLWVFAVKLKAFVELSFTSDLFVSVQLARSWLEGRLLEDNCFGRHLAIHTYFFLLPLGLLAKPLGAPGLFVALGAGIGASSFLAHRILRLLGVGGRTALVAGFALVSLPVSVWTFADGYGFHVELMLPPLALGFFYALLRRSLGGALAMALLVSSVKEEAPLIVGIIAVMVIVETRIADRAWHRPALASLALAGVLLPILLAILRAQPHGPYTVNHFAILESATAGRIHGVSSLAGFAATNLLAWCRFGIERRWPLLFFVATLGTLLLRPWYAPLGLVTTGVAWLLQVDLLWAPRFASGLAFSWCVILLGLASLVRATGRPPRTPGSKLALATGVAVVSLVGQLHFVRQARDPLDLHLFRPSPYTGAERSQADRLFAVYRREGRATEPVAASPYLFRYAHDRNLYWLDRLAGRPRPIWILQDGSWTFTDFGLAAADYAVVGRDGRFTLLKRAVNRGSEP
jgi:hypothetical protein